MPDDTHSSPEFQVPNYTPRLQQPKTLRPLPLRVRTFGSIANSTRDADSIHSPEKNTRNDHDHDSAPSRTASSNARSRNSPASFSGPSSQNPLRRVSGRAKSQAEITTITEESPRTLVEDHSFASGDSSSFASPPGTPSTMLSASERGSLEMYSGDRASVLAYDFAKLDYQLEQARVLGRGLWSTVYLAEQTSSALKTPARQTGAEASLPSPPSTPRRNKHVAVSGLVAVKMPSRGDANSIFRHEAKTLTHLQQNVDVARQYIVQFFGLDPRNDALVFEAVIGGSLENLCGRLRQMTEVSRHLELIKIFPGIANDLISGLEFIHASGVVHADIKPGNVLLDMHELSITPNSRAVIRARFIDFSAAFLSDTAADNASNAGGTWDYMAPEQMRILQKDLSTPTFTSDVWSLGITLTSIIVGESPYAAACAGNLFRLREAIKSGDPLGFARMDPIAHQRLAACQDFVDCCRLALKKDRENRVTASVWTRWLRDRQLGD